MEQNANPAFTFICFITPLQKRSWLLEKWMPFPFFLFHTMHISILLCSGSIIISWSLPFRDLIFCVPIIHFLFCYFHLFQFHFLILAESVTKKSVHLQRLFLVLYAFSPLTGYYPSRVISIHRWPLCNKYIKTKKKEGKGGKSSF